jgi:hypothetical protein
MFNFRLVRFPPWHEWPRSVPRAVTGFTAAALLATFAGWSLYTFAVGITHKLEVTSRAHLDGIELAPDGSRVAIGVTVDHVREPNALGEFPDGGTMMYSKRRFEVMLFDLRQRAELVRLTSITRGPQDALVLKYWDSTGIVVLRATGRTYRVIRVDPTTGRSLNLPAAAGRLAVSRSVALHPGHSGWDDLRRRHVYERWGQFFLWNPETHHAEHLFDMPNVWDGHVEEFASANSRGWRGERLLDGLLKVWDASLRQERDSVRVTLETYAPRPSSSARPYRVTCTLWVLDTIAVRRLLYQGVSLALDSSTRLLGPATTHVDAVIAYAALQHRLLPYAKFLSVYPTDSVTVTIGVQLHPMSLPTDSALSVIVPRHVGWQDVSVTVPAHGLVAPRPAHGRGSRDQHVRGDQDGPH